MFGLLYAYTKKKCKNYNHLFAEHLSILIASKFEALQKESDSHTCSLEYVYSIIFLYLETTW